MMPRFRYYHSIHIDPGQADKSRIQAAIGDHFFHLNNDLPARVVGGLRLRNGLGVYTLLFKCAVPVFIGIGGTDDCNIDGK